MKVSVMVTSGPETDMHIPAEPMVLPEVKAK